MESGIASCGGARERSWHARGHHRRARLIHIRAARSRRPRTIAIRILDGREDLDESRVAFLITPGFDWVAVQWAIWRAGGIAVPLPMNHPPAELDYLIRDAETSIVIADADNAAVGEPLARASGAVFHTIDPHLSHPANVRSVRLQADAASPAKAGHYAQMENARAIDRLHEWHDGPSERRGDDTRGAQRADRIARHGLGMDRFRSHAARRCRCITSTVFSTSCAARYTAAPPRDAAEVRQRNCVGSSRRRES